MKKNKGRLIVVGDRVLVTPDEGQERTDVGLYLPQTVADKDSVQSGRIVETGPGIVLPDLQDMDDEPWKSDAHEARTVPMQAHIGDYAIFLRKAAVEIKYQGKPFLVVPQAAILVLIRDEEPLAEG
jgi:co-chaperonin GroES (HSP10)